MIPTTQLLTTYVNQPMLQYFQRKLPQLSQRDLQIQLEETLKFLFMAEECSGAIPVSRELDEIWHFWILQTQEYMSLCERLPAGHYIHHSSNDYEKYFDAEVSERSNLLLDIKMLALYAANFGAFEEERINHWLLAKHLVNKCGWSVEQLNEWLSVGASNQQIHAPTMALLAV